MQSQDDLPIPSETPLNLKMFNSRLTRSLIPASSCGFLVKDFELPIQVESEVQVYNLSVGLLQCSWSGARRKIGNVALSSPIGVPGLDQLESYAKYQLSGSPATKRGQSLSWSLRSKAAGQNHKHTPTDAEARFSAAVDQMKAS